MAETRTDKKGTAAQKHKPKGLTSKEAASLLKKYGPNQITEKKKNYYAVFLKKLYGPVPILLWIVILLSYIMHHMADFFIILILLIFNAFVSFFEEYRADNTLADLRKRLASYSRVMRDGKWIRVEACLIVCGDVIRLRAGDIIPADCRIIECEGFYADESSLTGESIPKEKSVNDTVYSSTIARSGEATCVVLSTGMDTKYGQTAKLISSKEPPSKLEKVVTSIVKYLVAADIVAILAMFTYGTYFLHLSVYVTIPFLLIMFIASVPVALSAAFTVSMALGSNRLAKRSILVTKLSAIESAATMNILCFDKTGTLTQNKIKVKEIVSYAGGKEEVIRYAAEASRRDDSDPIDDAVLDYSEVLHLKFGRQQSFIPFDSSRKYTSALIMPGGYEVRKGSVDVLIDVCKPGVLLSARMRNQTRRFASKGFRTIAVVAKLKGKWRAIGLIALYDPPRPDAAKLIGELRDLGVSIRMLTGDNIAVAQDIASELGIGGRIVDLSKPGSRSLESISRDVLKADGFASVYPEDKYTIVKALQSKGFTVGMTGDGVNDAPALKRAEVGIAVSTATDVAKGAADMVLTSDGIEVLVDIIKESRKIFERMANYAILKVTRVFQIVGFVLIAFIILAQIPITALLLILLLFTNDIVNISISTDHSIYSRRPDTWNVKSLVYASASIGVPLMLETLVLIPLLVYYLHIPIASFQTAVFLMFNVSQNMAIFAIRERKHFWNSRPSTPLLITTSLGMFAGFLIAYYGIFVQKLSPLGIGIVFLLSLATLFFNDQIKIKTFRLFGIG